MNQKPIEKLEIEPGTLETREIRERVNEIIDYLREKYEEEQGKEIIKEYIDPKNLKQINKIFKQWKQANPNEN